MQQRSTTVSSIVVIIFSLCALFVPVLFTELSVMKFTNGAISYPLDDTYIHMAIAKNLAQNGTWGINAHEFSAASSSILYSILLAICFKIFSINITIPIIINAIAAIVLIIVIQKRLQKENVSYVWQFVILFFVIFFTPLPAQIISGMEHTLQCLFSFLFIFIFNDWWNESKNDRSKKLPVSLFITGFLVCAIRYEGMFLAAIVCCILLFNKKIIPAFILGFISLLPVIIFGLYSISKGSYFIPNSVLIKSEPSNSTTGPAGFISTILIDKLTLAEKGITSIATQRMLIILPATYLLFRKFLGEKNSYAQLIFILTACTLLQLAFASTGWFYRYEAYLILCSTIVVALVIYKNWKQFISSTPKIALSAILFLAFMLAFPLVLRSTAAYTKAKQACINIYEQQNQMAQFIKQFYYKDTVGLNDIGAVSFYKQDGVLDLFGLADIDVARSKKDHYNTPDFLYKLANKNDMKIAVVYDKWFDSSLLQKWQKVATWQIQNNVICGDSIVTFYAVKPNLAPTLKSNLIMYQKELPQNIKIEYYNEQQ